MRYTPLLRWKRGEKVGLTHVQASARNDVVPYIELSSDRFRGKKPTKSSPAITPPNNFVSELQKVWPNDPVIVDATRLAARSGPHPVEEIAKAAATAGRKIIPSTFLSPPAAFSSALTKAVTTSGAGVALKIDLQELGGASTWISSWTFPLAETDLIIDLSDNVEIARKLGQATIDTFDQLPKGKQWRSVTIAGSSMPENFTGLTSGKYKIDRHEWLLWKELQKAGLSYDLHYGDFATVPVIAPPTGIAWGFPINARYTLENEFLICRGVRTKGVGAKDMDVQLKAHAKTIVAEPSRAKLPGCWADDEIDRIASGGDPGNLESWVRIAVCRHVERVRNDLP